MNPDNLERDYRIYLRDVDRAETLNCCQHDAANYVHWECCETHRELKVRSKVFESAAEAIYPINKEVASVLSAYWWKESGHPEMHDFLMERSRATLARFAAR